MFPEKLWVKIGIARAVEVELPFFRLCKFSSSDTVPCRRISQSSAALRVRAKAQWCDWNNRPLVFSRVKERKKIQFTVLASKTTWPSPDHHLTITWPSPDHTWPTWSQSMQVICRNPIEPHATLRTPSNPMEVHGLPIQSHGINIHHRRPQTVGGKVLGGTGRLMILGRLVRCLKVSHVAQNRNRNGPKLMTNSWQTDWLSGCSWKHAWTCVNCWGKSPESSPSEGLAAKRRQHHAVQLVLELRRLFGYCALAI